MYSGLQRNGSVPVPRMGQDAPGEHGLTCGELPWLFARRPPRPRADPCTACLAVAQLPAIGVGQEFISFKNTTMESDKYICVRETGAQNTVVIVDMANPMAPARRPITADSALMCTDKKVIALKATTPGVAGDTLQVFNLDTKQKLRTYQMPESVEYWKWITPTSLGLVTAASVYHWDIDVSANQAAATTCLPCLAGCASSMGVRACMGMRCACAGSGQQGRAWSGHQQPE